MMTVQKVNDTREFIWLSSDVKPTIAPYERGARGTTLDTGEKWIFDGDGWVQDLTLIYAFRMAAI
uniref:Uncharacterized protein n=1 Tax=viral metagenome TaxID=1070528 RepID=A0A6M3IYL7_9ZZZZ